MRDVRGARIGSWVVGLALSTWLAHGALAQAPATWAPADPAYVLSLPRDHASHPAHKIEWWYYTGNVATKDGRRFGYQLTFFRVGVDPAPANPSRWAVRDLYMTHLAVTDIASGKHVYADRLSRAGVGWAGALTDRYRVWNEDWVATLDARGRHVLRARDGGLGLDLVLDEGKPWVAQGANGYSRKGSEPGNASHYYSLTRMPTRGAIIVAGESFEVEGLSWMDHEFGSSFLEPAQLGWDWFALQLDEGTDLMLYEMRRQDGRRDPHSKGTVVDASGRSSSLPVSDFTLEPLERWTSASSKASYPVAWRVRIPSRRAVLTVRAVIPAQELRTERSTRVTYWEGAVTVDGEFEGRAVRGRGYLEMTGYSGRSLGSVLR